MQIQEVVEAQGHLIDSHVMEEIFDKVAEYSSRFEVEQFRIGRTNSDASYLRLKVETPTQEVMDHLLQQLLGLGCSPVDSGDAQLRTVERDRCAPEDFYSTTNHRTLIRHRQWWRGCAASASCRNRKSATGSPSLSCRTGSLPSGNSKRPCARPPRCCSMP